MSKHAKFHAFLMLRELTDEIDILSSLPNFCFSFYRSNSILVHIKECFSFTNHLVSATLLQADSFQHYTVAFPEDVLSKTLQAYPVLNGSKLKIELRRFQKV